MYNPNEINMSQDQIEVLTDKLDSIQKQFNDFAEEQSLLVTLISGNKYDKSDKGMVGRFSNMNKRVTRLERVGLIVFGGGLVVTFTIKYVLPLFQYIFK